MMTYTWKFFYNSLIVSTFTILIVLTLSIIAAYSLSKLKPIAKNTFFNLILIGLMVPGAANANTFLILNLIYLKVISL